MLFAQESNVATYNISRINILALGARLPTIHPLREYLGSGGLMSYGANNADLFRRSADFVNKILRGSKPGDIPVEQPTKFVTERKRTSRTAHETAILAASRRADRPP